MTAILGISAYYHDSAAALVVDGEIVAAAQEERFTRKKHDHEFPRHSIRFCLDAAGLAASDLDYVGFYDKPLLKFDRLLETYLAYAPAGFRSFRLAMPLWLNKKLHLPREIRRELGGAYRRRIIWTDHHESHAASAFFPSPFEEAAVLTVDGVGEWATASFGVGRGNHLSLTHELHFPHSLGLLYSALTYFCGFKVNSGEYKLMGLAPYGEAAYADLMREKLLDIKEDGSFRMDMSYFNYCQGLTMTSKRFEDLFGGPPRKPESRITQREMDLAASVQVVTEEILMRMVRHVHRTTGMKKLCLAGGVALNCVANGKILREGPIEDLWIQPAAGDAGGALGVASFIWHQLLGKTRQARARDTQRGSLLGPGVDGARIESLLAEKGARYRRYDDESELCLEVAKLMEAGRVIGWMDGRMEFGPRALGARSIIGDARSTKMQSEMNLKIKFRESFRPFAPAVLRERVDEYFETRPEEDSPYMLLVAPVRTEKRRNGQEVNGARGFDKLRTIRSDVPAITHVDFSARIQTVDAERHGRYYKLIRLFAERTGCPVVINTSFNVRGEPIVCYPEHAYRCFMATDMDVLVMGDYVLLKEEQPAGTAAQDRDRYLAQFELD
jgi:carbamoyltransferase